MAHAKPVGATSGSLCYKHSAISKLVKAFALAVSTACLLTQTSLPSVLINGAGRENRTPNLLITSELPYHWAIPAYWSG